MCICVFVFVCAGFLCAHMCVCDVHRGLAGDGALAAANLPRLLVTTLWHPKLPGIARVIKEQQHSRKMTTHRRTWARKRTLIHTCAQTCLNVASLVRGTTSALLPGWLKGTERQIQHSAHKHTRYSHYLQHGEPGWHEQAKWESSIQLLD